TAMWFDLHQDAEIDQSVHNDVTVALFQLLEHLPVSTLAIVIGILLIVIFLITSADSATFIMASMTTIGSLNPT
ncbi:BCCT family transporter, partial [Lysinibacillus fusiformis]|uniref:BCCT family transporter n=1 Tax=Lysinibacillus fusiformis TaxID=28031 RepID=UPI00201BCC24